MIEPTVPLLAAVALTAVGLANGFAHHDELAARRFRTLDPRIVGSRLDRSRNRRWHRAGFGLRLGVVVVVAALVTLATGRWLAGSLALLVAGGLVSLLFDIIFNLRFGMPWYYAGTTAWTDEWLNKFGLAHHVEAGKLSAALELGGVLAGVVAWLVIF